MKQTKEKNNERYVKVTHKNKKIAEMLELFMNKHIEENPQMYQDMEEMMSKIAFFNLKYGTNFTISTIKS